MNYFYKLFLQIISTNHFYKSFLQIISSNHFFKSFLQIITPNICLWLWFHDSMIPWFHDSMIPWFHDSMIPWFHDFMISWFHDSKHMRISISTNFIKSDWPSDWLCDWLTDMTTYTDAIASKNQWRKRHTSSGKLNFQKDEIVAHQKWIKYICFFRLGWINLLNQVTFIISDYQILSISVYTNYIIIWHFNRN